LRWDSHLFRGDVALVLPKTEDAAYWGEQFKVTSDDLQYLSTALVDREVPLAADELARVLMAL
jgi:hypothetical protein